MTGQALFLTFLLLLASSLLNAQNAPSAPLKIAYSASHSEPYSFTDKGQITAGIIKDLMDALAEQLGTKAEYLLLPRKRIPQYLLQGKADIKVIANPAWEPQPDKFLWSAPLFTETQILVLPNNPTLSSEVRLDNLPGDRIGTILGYSYPILEAYFREGSLQRIDSRELELSFKMLMAGRLDALVSSEILVRHHLKTQGASRDYRLVTGLLPSYEIRLMISQNTRFSLVDINRASQHLKDSGKVRGTLNTYLFSGHTLIR